MGTDISSQESMGCGKVRVYKTVHRTRIYQGLKGVRNVWEAKGDM